MALGEVLKNARVQRGLTPSDVAENTHLMVQIVEDLEREDFKRVAAPIYGRGFIKLYSDLLELDPEPLIRDFMDLYAGSRAPAVRTKKVEAQADSTPESVPVTRTVSGPAPLSPQRQAVQPRPAVRPLSSPQPVSREETAEPELARRHAAINVAEAAPAPSEAESEEQEPLLHALAPECGTVAVEEADAEERDDSGEPDLFRPQSLRRKSYDDVPADEEPDSEEPQAVRKPRLPIFKIGGRMSEAREPAEQDEAAHARRRARIQAFVDGVTKLKEGVERKLPSTLPHKQLIALGGVGVAALILMALGIKLLFDMTGTNVKQTPSAIVKNVAPPPDLYVD